MHKIRKAVIWTAVVLLALLAIKATAQAEEEREPRISLRGLLQTDAEVLVKPDEDPKDVSDSELAKGQETDKDVAVESGASCSDRATNCKSLARQGYCASKWYYRYLSIRNYWCRRSCGVCCHNYLYDSQCNRWRKYCYRNNGYYYYWKGYTVDAWCPVTCARC